MDKTNTPDELVDVVNGKDQVIGQATKGQVNSNPALIHREIAILLYSGDKVLIQQRSHNKAVMPLIWTTSVAGHIPRGMAPEAAAHMELTEELGFDTSLSFIKKEFFRMHHETHFCYDYAGELPKSLAIQPNFDEIEKIKLVNRKELEQMIEAGEHIEEGSKGDFYLFWNGKIRSLPKPLRAPAAPASD